MPFGLSISLITERESLFPTVIMHKGTKQSLPVSTLLMGATVKRTVLGIFVLLLATTLALVGLSYSLNRSRKLLAKQMMSDAARLKVGTDIADVRSFAKQYNGKLSAKWQQNPCAESDCLAVTTVPLEFPQRHPKIADAYYLLLNRYWSYSVFIWIENGKVTAQEQWFSYETPKRTFAVITDTSPGSVNLCQHSSYRMHHSFIVEMAPKHFSVWVDPNGPESERISKLDLECVSGLRGCRSLSEMAPEAWHRYEADQRFSNSAQPTQADDANSHCTEYLEVR